MNLKNQSKQDDTVIQDLYTSWKTLYQGYGETALFQTNLCLMAFTVKPGKTGSLHKNKFQNGQKRYKPGEGKVLS